MLPPASTAAFNPSEPRFGSGSGGLDQVLVRLTDGVALFGDSRRSTPPHGEPLLIYSLGQANQGTSDARFEHHQRSLTIAAIRNHGRVRNLRPN